MTGIGNWQFGLLLADGLCTIWLRTSFVSIQLCKQPFPAGVELYRHVHVGSILYLQGVVLSSSRM